uniref:Uncharacterized protein n=1 Tax=Heterorhabditis bacteriophora TaxID=37862 RepID=A0A1I7WQR7_HETBA
MRKQETGKKWNEKINKTIKINNLAHKKRRTTKIQYYISSNLTCIGLSGRSFGSLLTIRRDFVFGFTNFRRESPTELWTYFDATKYKLQALGTKMYQTRQYPIKQIVGRRAALRIEQNPFFKSLFLGVLRASSTLWSEVAEKIPVPSFCCHLYYCQAKPLDKYSSM